jgi:LPS export ABC transporter protein LptC
LKNNVGILVSGIVLICIGFSQCRQDAGERTIVRTRVERPIQEGWDSKITITRLGLPQAIVDYGHMVKYEKSDTIYFDEGVEVDFFDDQGNHSSHLISDRGEYNEKTEDVTGIGNVIVVSDSGVTLNTEILRWDNARGKIYSDTLVMVTTREADTLYGIGFESNADLTRRVIYSPWGKTKRSLEFDDLESQEPDTIGSDPGYARKDSTRSLH